MSHCHDVAVARNNLVAHPDTQAIDAPATKAYLYHISEMLGHINCPNEKGQVEEFSKSIPGQDNAKLEASLGDLEVKLDNTIQRLERLGML